MGYRLFKTSYNDRKGKPKEAAKWYVEFKDHLETIRRLPAFTSKAASEEVGRNLVKMVEYHKATGGQILACHFRWPTRAFAIEAFELVPGSRGNRKLDQQVKAVIGRDEPVGVPHREHDQTVVGSLCHRPKYADFDEIFRSLGDSRCRRHFKRGHGLNQ